MNLAEDVEDVLIPDALEYYLGLNDDLYDGEGDSSDGEGGDAGSDGGDSDDDKPKAKKKGKGEKKGPEGAAGQQQECKQQWQRWELAIIYCI